MAKTPDFRAKLHPGVFPQVPLGWRAAGLQGGGFGLDGDFNWDPFLFPIAGAPKLF